MHIPDGFLSVPVSAASYAVSAVTGGAALVRAKKKLTDRFVPLVGICAAFIFAAQMINFPVGVGVSGHFLGAMLACILLGPAAGFWVMVLVLTVQCLVFADGGITALGANVMNMGLIGGIISYFIFLSLVKILPKGKGSFLTSTFFMSWFSVVFASFICGLELWFSLGDVYTFKALMAALLGVHLVIGLGEAIITTAVLTYMLNARPDLVYAWSSESNVGLNKEVLANG
jgi:cobalt/nickel transport system permease protein